MRLSATMIAKRFGKSTKEIYSLLKEQGFLDGNEGNWSLTELGKQVGGQIREKDNGEGGFCRRVWQVLSWDEKIVDIVDDILKKNNSLITNEVL